MFARRDSRPHHLRLQAFAPVVGRGYGGAELFRAYSSHPDFAQVPMVVAASMPDHDREIYGNADGVIFQVDLDLPYLCGPHP